MPTAKGSTSRHSPPLDPLDENILDEPEELQGLLVYDPADLALLLPQLILPLQDHQGDEVKIFLVDAIEI